MKLLIVEDHPFIRVGLRHMIRQPYPDCEITEADTAEQGLLLALNEPFDLILLDLGLPWSKGGKVSFTQGLELLDNLRISPGIPPVVVMSGITREAPATLARERGAVAVVLKGAAPEKLWEVMESCLQRSGRTAISHLKKQEPLPEAFPASVTPADLGISPRMLDVLRLALQGHPSKRIAQILDINGSNVRHYLSKLYAKFGVSNLGGLQAHFALSGKVISIISSPNDEKNAA